MRSLDILGLALSALWQQKTRTVLTTLGVVFGSFVLAASLSIGQGVQETIEREAGRNEFLRRINVSPIWHDSAGSEVKVEGEMSDDKRQRLLRAMAAHQARFQRRRPPAELTRDMLRRLAALDHVEEVVPILWMQPFATLNGASVSASLVAARSNDGDCRKRLLAGRLFQASATDEILVSEFLLYRCGLANDAVLEQVLGKTIVLEFRATAVESGIGVYLIKPDGGEHSRLEILALDKVRQELPGALEHLKSLTPEEKEVLRLAARKEPAKARDTLKASYTIVGVLRLPTEEETSGRWDPLRTDGDLVLPIEAAENLFFRIPRPGEASVDNAVVVVDRKEHVKQVVEQLRAMGLGTHAVLEFIEREQLMYLLIFGAMTCVAAVALLVAALGIANTMLMSVLERTREIGVMKAVGAGNGQLQTIFLVEGALIGLVGGAVGLALGWVLSFPADGWLRSMVSRDLKIDLKEPVFVFPPWLPACVLAFAVIVTVVAALYPARRAARVDPVTALRHE